MRWGAPAPHRIPDLDPEPGTRNENVMSKPYLHVTARDGWGAAVADELAAAPEFSVAQEAALPEAAGYLVVAAHENTDLLSARDRLAFGLRRPWAPLILTASGVRLGPVVVPGRSACYQCFLRRWLQHDPQGEHTAAMLRDDRAIPAHSVAGHLPSDVLIGSGLARALAEAIADGFGGRVQPGDVVRFSVAGGTVRRDRVIAVPGCRRCGPRRDRAADTWQGLALALGANNDG